MFYFHLFSLKAFLTVVELGSFSKAAQRLFVTQPAISAQIKNLERLLGIKLIIRKHNSINLTEAGHKFYLYAQRMEKIYEELITDIAHYQTNKKTIGIGSSLIPGKYWLPRIISTFSKKNPGIKIRVEIKTNNEIIKQVLSGNFDLGIVSIIPQNQKIFYRQIVCCELTLIAHPDYPKEEISLEELTRESLVMREEDSGSTVCFRNLCKNHGFDLDRFRIPLIVNCNESVKFAVKEGKGIGIVPKCTVLDECKKSTLKMVKLKEGELRHYIYLIYLPNKLDFLTIRNFYEFINQIAIKNFYKKQTLRISS